jgi:hypothetical protein
MTDMADMTAAADLADAALVPDVLDTSRERVRLP